MVNGGIVALTATAMPKDTVDVSLEVTLRMVGPM
jgi:hypothetical protein